MYNNFQRIYYAYVVESATDSCFLICQETSDFPTNWHRQLHHLQSLHLSNQLDQNLLYLDTIDHLSRFQSGNQVLNDSLNGGRMWFFSIRLDYSALNILNTIYGQLEVKQNNEPIIPMYCFSFTLLLFSSLSRIVDMLIGTMLIGVPEDLAFSISNFEMSSLVCLDRLKKKFLVCFICNPRKKVHPPIIFIPNSLFINRRG